MKQSNLTLIREIATHLAGARNDISIKHIHDYYWICVCIVSIFCVATILLPTLDVLPPLHAETLEDAWNIALSNDHRLQASRMNVDSGRQSLSAAKSARFPVLSLESGYTVLNNAPAARLDEPMAVLDRIPTAEDKSLYYKTTLTLPFYTGGRISTEIDAAIANLNTAVQDEMKTILDLKLDVADAYISAKRDPARSTSSRRRLSSKPALFRFLSGKVQRLLSRRVNSDQGNRRADHDYQE